MESLEEKLLQTRKGYVKHEDIVYIKLNDGRVWVPSQQVRGTTYDFKELIDKKDDKYRGFNFVAIDFETATAQKGETPYPCQIGICVVRNGAIDETICRYIKPPHNKYDLSTIKIHHITPEVTKDEPEFDEVWPDIVQYFEGEQIIAHNARFDIKVLVNALEQYQLPEPDILGYTCTMNIHSNEKKKKLDDLCEMYKIPLCSHHDALCDAVACANIFLKYLGEEPDLSHSQDVGDYANDALNQTEPSHSNGYVSLHGELLEKDLSGADPNNPFYDKKVVITGQFPIGREELALKLKKMGADNNTTISKKTQFVLKGTDPGPAKLQKITELTVKGCHIQVLEWVDIEKILNGEDWDKYQIKSNNPEQMSLF